MKKIQKTSIYYAFKEAFLIFTDDKDGKVAKRTMRLAEEISNRLYRQEQDAHKHIQASLFDYILEVKYDPKKQPGHALTESPNIVVHFGDLPGGSLEKFLSADTLLREKQA